MKLIHLTKSFIACSIIYSSTVFSQITGSGTANNIPKFTAASAIGNSQITDNGTTVSLGTASLAVGPSGILTGDFVTFSKNQNGLSKMRLANGTPGTIAGSLFHVAALGANLYLASYSTQYIGSGIKQPSVSVVESAALGGLNVGSSTNSQLSFWTNNISRMSITSTGSVGIGTTTPDKWLTVVSPTTNKQIAKFADNTNYIGLGGNEVAAFDLAGNTANLYLGGSLLNILTSGNVGVGITNPSSKLEVAGNAKVIGLESTINHGFDFGFNEVLNVTRNLTKAIGVFNTTDPINTEKFIVWGSGRADIKATTKTDKYFVINDVSVTGSPVEALSIQGNGYTQYNVSNPAAMPNVIDVFDNTVTTNAKYLFRVSSTGHVYAREVEIRNTTLGFPDYVFAKDYKLMPLSEVEKYIDSNKHLPGFEKGEMYDQNGIKTSELIYKQQEKIEELTLYIIELEKRMKAIEESNKH